MVTHASRRRQDLNLRLWRFLPSNQNRLAVSALINRGYFTDIDQLVNTALFGYLLPMNIYAKLRQEQKPAQEVPKVPEIKQLPEVKQVQELPKVSNLQKESKVPEVNQQIHREINPFRKMMTHSQYVIMGQNQENKSLSGGEEQPKRNNA